jgi:hypothetical protein
MQAFPAGPGPAFDVRGTQLVDRSEGPDPQEVLLERSDEPLGAAVAFGLADERRRTLDSEERQLVLEVVAHVLAAVVVAEFETGRDVGGEAAEVLAGALTDRFKRLEPVRRLRRMETDAFAGAVIHGHEHGRRAFRQCDRTGEIRSPPRVRRVGGDRTVVCPRSSGVADAVRGLETVFTHEASDTLLARADTAMAEACPDLAVSLAVEWRIRQDRADVLDELFIRAGADGTSSARPRSIGFGRRLESALRVDRRATDAAQAADPL